MINEGRYPARAVEWSQFTANENSGNEEIRVLFKIQDENAGEQLITWYGYATEGTAERTIEALRIMGWTGDDITDVQGLDANEVQIVVRHEEYQGKTRAKVAFVNRAQGVFMGTPLDTAKKQAFAARMKGLVVASKQGMAKTTPNPKAANGARDDDFPFGDNAPGNKKAASGVKL